MGKIRELFKKDSKPEEKSNASISTDNVANDRYFALKRRIRLSNEKKLLIKELFKRGSKTEENSNESFYNNTVEKKSDKTLEAAHSVMNFMANTFFDKRDKNPNQDKSVNDEYPVQLTKVDTKMFTYSSNINYSDLKYIHQETINSCADTSVEMILNYHTSKYSEISNSDQNKKFIEEFIAKFNKRDTLLYSGKNTDQIKQYSDKLGEKECNIKTTAIEELAFYLYRYGPIIVRLNTLAGHFVVVKGVVDNKIIVHDSWYGPNKTYSFEKFKKKWDGTLIYFVAGFSKEIETKTNTNKEEINSLSTKMK